jgi:hypothetical protein
VTKGLNGLNPVHREIFDKANYLHHLGFNLDVDDLDTDRFDSLLLALFRPGQEVVETVLEIELENRPMIGLSPEEEKSLMVEKEKKRKTMPYKGVLEFSLSSDMRKGPFFTDSEILDITLIDDNEGGKCEKTAGKENQTFGRRKGFSCF